MMVVLLTLVVVLAAAVVVLGVVLARQARFEVVWPVIESVLQCGESNLAAFNLRTLEALDLVDVDREDDLAPDPLGQQLRRVLRRDELEELAPDNRPLRMATAMSAPEVERRRLRRKRWFIRNDDHTATNSSAMIPPAESSE